MTTDIDFFGNKILFKNGEKVIYHSEYSISCFKHRKKLYNFKDQLVCDIKTKINFSGIKHILDFKGFLIELKLKGSPTKNYYQCKYKTNLYKIIIHRRHKTSIFMNSTQIGYYSKEISSMMSAKKINLITNSDIDKELIFSIISAIELSLDGNEYINFDLGNLGGEYQSFDKNWKPNN